MLYNFKKWGPQYTLIGGSKTGLEAPADHRSYFRPHSKLLTILVGALVIIASFFAGKWSSTGHNPLSELNRELQVLSAYILKRYSPLSLVGTKSFEFMYNRTFGEVPSNKSTKAWADLFPTQGGYFIHPTIAPKRSVFSVFHQLHCLVNFPDLIIPSIACDTDIMNRTECVKDIGRCTKPLWRERSYPRMIYP